MQCASVFSVIMQAARSSYEQYVSLAAQHAGHHTHSQMVSDLLCDRCLQPIDEATFQSNASRLEVCDSLGRPMYARMRSR